MREESGFTLLELLVTISLAAVMTGFAVLNLKDLSNPALNAASDISGFLKLARSKALSTTSAYTISASSTDTLIATVGTTCSAAQTPDPSMTLFLADASLTDITWTICFSSRGFPDANVSIPVVDVYAGANTVEILLGGSIRIL